MRRLTGHRLKARNKGAPKKKKEAPPAHGMLDAACLSHGRMLTLSSEEEEVVGGMRSMYDIPSQLRRGLKSGLPVLGLSVRAFWSLVGNLVGHMFGPLDVYEYHGRTAPRGNLYHTNIESWGRLEDVLLMIRPVQPSAVIYDHVFWESGDTTMPVIPRQSASPMKLS